MPKTIKNPIKLDEEALKAKVLLLEQEKASTSRRIAISLQLVPISSKAIIAAKNSIEQGKRADKRIANQKGGKALSKDEVKKLWPPVLAEIKKAAPRWQLALDSRIEFKKAVVNYKKALEPLEDALKMGADSGLPGVESECKSVAAKLEKAKGYIDLVDEKAQKSITEMQAMLGVISVLEGDPPNSREDILGAQTEFEKSIVVVRTAELAVKNQVAATNEYCISVKDSIEQSISDIVTTIVGWRRSEDTRKMIDIAESFIGGAVKMAQIASGEPMSASAAQGVHMLIKGICSAAGKFAAWLEKQDIKEEFKDVLDQIDLVQPDDFINWKLDLIKEGLQWLAEPLGFIPSVGALVVSCVNAATDSIVDSIREASKKAIEAEEKKKHNPSAPPPDVEEDCKTAEEVFTNTFKLMLDDGVETLHELSEYISGDKSPATIIVKACAAILGPPLTKVLGEVLPAMKPVSKEKLRGAVEGGRKSVEEQANLLKNMEKIDIRYAFDEGSAKDETQRALKAIPVGGSADCLIGVSDALPGAKCAVLVGSSHSDLNRNFVQTLIKNGDGHRGVIYKKKSGTFGTYVMAVDSDAHAVVKRYFQYYKLTSKDIEFE